MTQNMPSNHIKKNICVVTASRAEFGIMKPLIKQINECDKFSLQLVVTGSHLAEEFGSTVNEIIADDNLRICREVEIINEFNVDNTALIMAETMIKFSECFIELNPDMVVVLGDRYEIFSVSSVATTLNIPICHLHGGETTEGAIDEAFRHGISKMSYLHFTASEEYRNRVIQLGEHPKRVFNVGALANESIDNLQLLSNEKLNEKLDFNVDTNTFLVTFHPVTLGGSLKVVEQQFKQLLIALEYAMEKKNLKIIFTKANADSGGIVVNRMIDHFVKKFDQNAIAFHSLGQLRYFSALKYCGGVIGNSSSGIIEVPMFKKVSINIGNRQRGRTQAESVINCSADAKQILGAIATSLSSDFQEKLASVKSPYINNENLNNKTISQYICEKMIECFDHRIDLRKQFFNLKFSNNLYELGLKK
ncbi:UDP-N-acetylglucosamine 2-epimerase [Lentisphaerota bacterium WC36G]|nr:UDP-N-acetylglucosamine 2-epimerase [Lentisphaerae bacterium WC36]